MLVDDLQRQIDWLLDFKMPELHKQFCQVKPADMGKYISINRLYRYRIRREIGYNADITLEIGVRRGRIAYTAIPPSSL